MPHPLIIAHRGASRAAPENTLAAFRLAWEMGADAVELDIRLSQDGEIVVMHDASTLRTTGYDALVRSLPLAALRELDAGSHKGNPWCNERVPTLREVLATVPAGRRIFIEIKETADIVAPLWAQLCEAFAEGVVEPGQVVVMTFSAEVSAAARACMPGLCMVYLGRFPKLASEWEQEATRLVAHVGEAGLQGVSLGVSPEDDPVCDARRWQILHEAGLLTFAWTVNDLGLALRLLGEGVGGIITDVPDCLLARRGG